eukprot:Seg2648.2 transcript_id=Seg2648.2/GoldUCD/mRNA.D3Y31 product="N-lysine methyltransferase setd6" protein_id=Seg2648.2/GoldUCD/D3Y31
MENATDKTSSVLQNFLSWCVKHKIKISPKVKVTNISTSHRYGIIAAEDIRCSETLVEIPRDIALTPNQGSIASRLREFKEANMARLQQTSGWISLLLALMYELKKEDSYWAPYLAICPDTTELNQPMFWSEEERQEELNGLAVLWDVQRDLFNIEREYQQFAVPFIEKNLDILSKESHDLSLYKHMVGFVMSYSFTDYQTNETLMVPVADIFNHHTNNNAQLSFDDESSLRMISTKPIKKGEEIFNTFGKLGNSHLLHMYGFVEKLPNPNDTVEIPLTQIVDALEATDIEKLPVLQAMLAFMRKMGIANEKEPFIFSTSGLKSGPDMYAVLRILHMDFREFTGLLQDHISWYQDGYFTYLLEHVHQAASRVQNSEDETTKNKADESDDEIMIVKEVKGGTKAKNEIEAVHTETKAGKSKEINNEEKNSVGRAEGNCVKEGKLDTNEKHELHNIKEGDSKDLKVNDRELNSTVKVASNCVKEGTLDADKKQVPTGKDTKKENEVVGSKCDQKKKSSPTSDSSRKSKNRKRKPAKPVNASDDSDDELIPRNVKLSKKRINNDSHVTNFVDKNHENDSGDVKEKIKGRELLVQRSGFVKGSAEDTAKWVLQLPSIEGEHSEDPEDGSDDDSETQLQLTYDQINSILPPSWKITMRSVVANALSQIKFDDSNTETSKMSQHAFLAYQVRSGQRRILQLLNKSLST